MRTTAVFEFHVSRVARDRYQFDELLFAFNGNVVFPNPLAARHFATRINQVRRAKDPSQAARASDLFAMGLIDEALHALVALYRRAYDQRATEDALVWFGKQLGHDQLERTLLAFVEQFPPMIVYRGEQDAAEWLATTTSEGLSHRAIAFEELMMLQLANANPAYKPYGELFDETLLEQSSYRKIATRLRDYFETRPRFGTRQQNLYDVLRAPALAAPESLAGQLAFLRENYKEELAQILPHLLTALDVLKEEELAVWSIFHPPGEQRKFGHKQDMGDSSEAAVPHFGYRGYEYERFSPDVDWMPSTVLLAKSVYVWLDQLSRKYQRHIHSLAQIPDEELALMSRRGFNALWLIGLWERSQASRRIKQLTGNPDAAASAYSLFDYRIAHDLGAEDAYNSLRERAQRYGIRLASDMVPNHMGIDSQWVIDNPDRFLSLPHPPYPAYTFNGPDLSSDGRVEIKIEDHYYDRTDAAVVFRRVDRWSGDTRYIYHGNDGTSFPWNDTAQLNYLNPDVREAVIQTIIHVARMFPIIRFDAAMTLTKQHFQRLWFPAPGSGGAIPSRAEHGLTKQQFDEAMPAEFWREVVDRIAVEVPGTLLLAEAFWLLEGYFVRTLGMHRVYNSAFMNMMRDEENANYRSVLKNTLEFDPDVMKRYVNFMNNPDERTAIDQFGKGDKYFGVCTLLATLPGLPMFGHGQIEGFTERYGMEFRRAQRTEDPDEWLVGRHEREISPLLHRRSLFAEVENFLLYDFYTDSGAVNEDVYAYSNRRGDDRALVVYHNRYAQTEGWVRLSATYAEKRGDGSKSARQKSLGESFGLDHDPSRFVAYRDLFTGQEYLHRASDVAERGLRIRLGAYEHHVFLDWRDLRDDQTHRWSELCDFLQGRGVPSLDDALHALELNPVHQSFARLLSARMIEHLTRGIEQIAQPAQSDIAEQPTPGTTEKPAKKAAAKKSAKTVAPKTAEKKVEPEPEPVQAPATPATATKPFELGAEFVDAAEHFYNELARYIGADAQRSASSPLRTKDPWDTRQAIELLRVRIDALRRTPEMLRTFTNTPEAHCAAMLPATKIAPASWAAALAWLLIEVAGEIAAPLSPLVYAGAIFDEARLRQPIADAVEKFGVTGEDRWRAAARVRFAFAHAAREKKSGQAAPGARFSWVRDPEVAWLIGANEHQGTHYFNKELYERLLWWMALPQLITIAAEPDKSAMEKLTALEKDLCERSESASKSGYKLEALMESGNLL